MVVFNLDLEILNPKSKDWQDEDCEQTLGLSARSRRRSGR